MVLWNEDEAQINVLYSSRQEIHMEVQVNGTTFTFYVSAIYASP